jgi:peroxiredoxin
MTLSQTIKTLVYAIAAVLVTACSPSSNGAMSPAVSFKNLAGQQFDMGSLKGQVVLINFWATSCTTCVKEMPMMTEVFNQFSPKGYRMVAVAMDYDRADFVEHFAKERKLPFDVVHDTSGQIAKAFDNTKLTPTSYLIDRQGKIVKRYVGEPKHDEFKAAIAALL